ncbi:MAG: rclR 2 [Phycisphaerales bacterium]|nr:rclR 2 [Phycisphaerales bacterium]
MRSQRSDDNRKELTRLLGEVAAAEGTQQTAIPGVSVTRQSYPSERHSILYKPAIVIVGQGSKRGYVGGDVYRYDAHNCLVLAVPLPAECEVDASSEEPLLVAAVALEPAMVSEMLLEIDEPTPPSGPVPRGISSVPLDDELCEAAVRLLKCARSPRDSRVLGRQVVREVVYRVLCGEQGGALRALANRDEHFTPIARVLRDIHADYARPLSVEELAKRAAMSPSMFHHYFKLVTASSPLQYLKRVRLDQARALMAHEGCNASTAATRVGYESASQFSREFRRLFGASPVEEAARLRARVEGAPT